jgi:hypothetical protein
MIEHFKRRYGSVLSEYYPPAIAIGLSEAYVRLTASSDLRARAFERP